MRVTFVGSVQGHQVERVREVADRLRKAGREVEVELVEGDAAKALLLQHKLNFGPAVLIDGRLEYVGIPRWGFLLERIAQVTGGLPNPRTAAPPAKPAVPATPARPTAAAPAKPSAPANPEEPVSPPGPA